LLDEPTASLDPDIAVKIREFLKRERKEYKVSMLFTSHNMTEVEEMCDRIVFLNKGKIIAEDKPENLAKQISDSEVELLIEEDEKATRLFTREKITYLKDRNIFRITIKTIEIPHLLTLLTSNEVEFQDISINKPGLEDYFLKISKGVKK
ncbi:MAG: hypothetical protein AAB907_01525, partial [Patescibacteria group bacterium]